MKERESWQEAGLTLDEPVEHVLRGAAYRRELAQFQTETGNVNAARQLNRLAGELRAAALPGRQRPEEMRVVDTLLPTWVGTTSEELPATARAILADESRTA